MQIFRDSTRKRRSLDSKIQALTMNEMMSKAHMQVHTNKELREKQPGKKPVPNRAETGLGQPTQPISGPVRHPLWPSRLSGYL
jgi:4'-phosphopantetheinyl transferase EntD